MNDKRRAYGYQRVACNWDGSLRSRLLYAFIAWVTVAATEITVLYWLFKLEYIALLC